MNGDPCKCGCGLPVMGRRWYACQCPNAHARAEDAYRKLLACQQRRRQALGGQARRTERLKDSTGRVQGDISSAEIERRFQQALADQRRARQTGQAA